MDQFPQSPESARQHNFEPATLALFGTSDARNPWRQPLIEALVELGVERARIFDPVIVDRPWDPELDQPHEIFQKVHAHSLIFYVGNNGEGGMSAYSALELGMLAAKRDPASTAVVLDSTGLEGHARKQIAATKQDLRNQVPELTVVDSIGESLGWITNKLHLHKELGTLALTLLQDRVTQSHSELAAQGITPDHADREARKRVDEAAQPLIQGLESQIMRDPHRNHFELPGRGVYAGRSDFDNAVSKFVETHFRDHRWRASSNRDGDLVITRPS